MIAEKAVRHSGGILLHRFGNISVREKGKKDIITETDMESEKVLIRAIHDNFPSHTICSEESGEIKRKKEYVWFIDPLDGTNYFSFKVPFFSVSVGLQYNDQMVLGLVYYPCLDELFWAERGKGAFLNKQRIHVSKTSELSRSVVSYDYAAAYSKIKKAVAIFSRLAENVRFARVYASEALELCYTACGRFDINVTNGTKPWDIAAGSLIVEEAGGKITDFKGNPWNPYMKNIVATNGLLHERVLKLLAGRF
jgi:myo-inositol-1(or 4)-monophosphatase